jgi:glyceraldehyde 3-phosphate dehydrogenase (phosphorylating)
MYLQNIIVTAQECDASGLNSRAEAGYIKITLLVNRLTLQILPVSYLRPSNQKTELIMSTVRVAINGFGRIGRLVYRQIYKMDGIDVVAINDLTSPKVLAHLLKYDSAQGRFDQDVKSTENSIVVNGDDIKIYAQKDPAQIPWKDHQVDVVLECTGFFTDKTKSEAHLKAGAKKVVISAPATGNLKTIVFNVNHSILDGSETIISCASCTTNCLAPMAQVLDEKFGIVNGLMTTVHAYTNDQNTQDAPHPKGDLRRARAAAQNIVPNSTGAAKAIGLVLPNLKGKLDGSAQRVPTLTGSLTEVTAVLGKKTTVEEINAAMKAASNESFGYTEDEIVSSDVIGISFGSLFDATQTKVQNVGDSQLVRTVSWYDNEMSYVSQLVRTLHYFAKLIK